MRKEYKMEKEDYFGDVESSANKRKSLAIVIYDISDNKQRTRMVKLLEGFGVRVQKSAFEAWLDDRAYSRLCGKIDRFIQPEDHVKIYRLSGAGETKSWGKMPSFEMEEIIII